MKTVKTTTAAITAAMALFATGALAATVKIDSVTQRWPWNNKVDIKYIVDGAADFDSVGYCKIVFTATVNGQTYTIDGATEVIAGVGDGTHTVTWTNAPAGVKSDDCKLSASLYATSGMYMVIDLNTGDYAFDNLAGSDTATASPTASNARYNTDLWKTDRMVLRRVPRTSNAAASYSSGYPTGHSDFSTTNSRKYWQIDKDYFIGVFMVTQYQYEKLTGTNPSTTAHKQDATGNPHELRPVNALSQIALRTDIPSTTAIPQVNAAGTGTFLQRLMYLTGNDLPFDLPTEIMFEIAARAGVTDPYSWGTSTDFKPYVVCYDNAKEYGSTGVRQSVWVGSKPSNKWGLFDMQGNIADRCRDQVGLTNLADATDAFTPYWAGSGAFAQRATPKLNGWGNANNTKVSQRDGNPNDWASGGFRVSVVIE